jgi:hypothetical protein
MIHIILEQDGSIVRTKEEILQTWKNSSPISTVEIKQILNSIQQKLNATTFSN